jgi:uncharacterized OB-fold protein
MIEPHASGFVQPVPGVDTQWWWQDMASGVLRIPRCRSCIERFFPPQPLCPHCGSRDWAPEEVDGYGRVYSWIVTHRAFSPEFASDIPYAIVAVDLIDGGRMIGRFRGATDDLRDKLPVRAEVHHIDGTGLLWFAPADPTG